MSEPNVPIRPSVPSVICDSVYLYSYGDDWWGVMASDPTESCVDDRERHFLAGRAGSVPEGTGAELRAIASAIESGRDEDFKRIACEPCDSGVRLWSPRNTMCEPPILTHRAALELVELIRSQILGRP